jgi:hypothetical protein
MNLASQPTADQPAGWTAPDWSAEPLVRRLPGAVAGSALLAAIAAGLLAQWLFAFQLLGLNFGLWIAVVLLAAWLYRPRDVTFDRVDAWLPVSAILFAAFVAVRADGMLLLFDLAAAGWLTLASVVAFGGRGVTRAAWQSVLAWAARAVAVFVVGAVYVLPGIRPLAGLFSRRRDGRWLPLLRGLLLALPLLIVFGVLFAAADAIFATQLRNVLNIGLGPDLVFRIVLATVAGWLFAGTLTCAWLAGRSPAPRDDGDALPIASAAGVGLHIGRSEALVLLIALDVLFAIFAALQAAYLFGGLDTFALSGMTYSDYARRGFFELIIAASLAGVVIIVVDRLVAEHGVAYRLAAVVLAALTGVVVLSALTRLGLYQAAYGWTELRFYALAAIGWLGIGVLVTFVAVLANRARWLPQLIVGAGLLVAFMCNAIGPQAFVTKQNVERVLNPALVADGGFAGLDVGYVSSLAADSIPVLVARRDQLPVDIRAQVDSILSSAAASLQRQATDAGWPSWNLARQRALDALDGAGY